MLIRNLLVFAGVYLDAFIAKGTKKVNKIIVHAIFTIICNDK